MQDHIRQPEQQTLLTDLAGKGLLTAQTKHLLTSTYFGPLKGHMRRLRFSADDEVKEAVSTWFKSQPADFHATGIQKPVP